MLAPNTPSPDDEALRRGAAALGRLGAGTGLVVVVLQVFLSLAVAGYADPLGPITFLLLAGTVAPAAMYLLCSRPSCGPGLARTLEHIAVLSTAIFYSATLLYFDVQHHFERVAILALTFVAIMRATLVPSGVVRTLVVTAAMVIPLVTFVALAYRSYVPYPGDALGSTQTPIVMSGWTVIWWSFTTWLSAMISGALENLRRQLRAARKRR